jgi:hypothetical protein
MLQYEVDITYRKHRSRYFITEWVLGGNSKQLLEFMRFVILTVVKMETMYLRNFGMISLWKSTRCCYPEDHHGQLRI